MNRNALSLWFCVINPLSLLCFPLSSDAQSCIEAHAHPVSQSKIVTLRGKPQDFAFYYRADDYLIFISPNQVMDALRSQELTGDRAAGRLLAIISERIPLKADQDLFYLNTLDWLFYSTIQKSIAIAIEDGNASITDLSGLWLDRAIVAHKRTLKMNNTVIYAGVKSRTRLLTVLDCIVG